MKILLTGANGLLGQKIIYLLKEDSKSQLIATGKGDCRLIHQDSFEYFPIDLKDKGEIHQLIFRIKPDVVIHAAAITNVDYCELNQEECWVINVESTKAIAKACEEVEAQLLYVSTDFVFDGKTGPYSENHQPNPVNYYGKSKLAAEKIVTQSNLSWAIIRTVLVYGVVDYASRSNVVLWAKRALESGKAIKVVSDQYRTPTLAEDLAKACCEAARIKAKGIYHVSGNEMMSIYDLVLKVVDFYGFDKSLISPVNSIELNEAAKRPPKTGFIIDKAKHHLNYQPTSFTEGLKLVDTQLNS